MGRLGRPEAFLAVFLAWVAIYLPALGAPELRGEEGRRILPAVTMLKTGNWLVPHIGGAAYYSKPPIINWLVAGSFLLTGRQDESAARLPSVLFLLAFVTLLIWFPGDWPRTEARLIAAVLFLTSFGVIRKGRRIDIEAVYVSLTSMSMLTWLALWVRGNSRWLLWLVPGAFLTLGMLTKGPPIFLFYYVPIVCILAYSRRLRTMLSAPHLVSLVLCLGVPTVWAYLASRGAADARSVVTQLSETLARLAPGFAEWSKWATQFLRSFANPLPWLFFLPLLWMRAFTSNIPSLHLPVLQGARLGLVLAFFAVALIPGNSGRYTMPLIGLESILLGWVLAEVGPLPDDGRLWRRSALAVYVLALLLGAAGLVAVRTDLWAAALLAAAVCLAVVLVRRRELFHTPVPLALLSALLAAVLMLEYALFVPRLMQRAEERRPVAAALDPLIPAGQSLYVYQPGFLDFLFYIRRPVEYLTDPAQIDAQVRFLLLSEPSYRKLKDRPVLAARLGRTVRSFTYRKFGDHRLLELSPPQAAPAPDDGPRTTEAGRSEPADPGS